MGHFGKICLVVFKFVKRSFIEALRVLKYSGFRLIKRLETNAKLNLLQLND